MALPSVTVAGTAVEDPTLRFTASGKALVNLRVAANDRRKAADGTWEDGEAVFLTVVAWNRIAENIAESITKGTAVLVTGRLQERAWDDKQGQQRKALEIIADDVAVSLRNATASVKRATRSSAAATPQDEAWG